MMTKATQSEIAALEAAISVFDDMIEGGSEDHRHLLHFQALSRLLKKLKIK